VNRILYVLVVAGLLLLTVNAFAAEEKTIYKDGNSTQGFGIHFGNVSGNGYAYRYIGRDLGIQLVVGGLTDGNNHHSFAEEISEYGDSSPLTLMRTQKGRRYNFNIGGNFILPLRRTTGSMFYLHAGANWKYSDQKIFSQYYDYDHSEYGTNTYYPTDQIYTTHKVKSYFNVGAGPGVELMAGKYFKLSLELPVTYTGDDEFIMYIPQAGLYYYFK
jgi:hypothetical protein